MALQVYWASGSPFAWRVLLTLEVKELPYESRLLSFANREHKSPEYLALNPRGKVPTLKDGDFVVYESLAVMAYLDKKYTDRPIFGASPRETGTIGRMLSENISYLCDPIQKVVAPLFAGSVAEKKAEIRESAAAVAGELTRLERLLESSPWLFGTSISAADIGVFPWIQSLLRAAKKDEAESLDLGLLPFDARYPHMADWVRRIEQIPGYQRTYPPHWK
jgi:glutathione S-transferase